MSHFFRLALLVVCVYTMGAQAGPPEWSPFDPDALEGCDDQGAPSAAAAATAEEAVAAAVPRRVAQDPALAMRFTRWLREGNTIGEMVQCWFAENTGVGENGGPIRSLPASVMTFFNSDDHVQKAVMEATGHSWPVLDLERLVGAEGADALVTQLNSLKWLASVYGHLGGVFTPELRQELGPRFLQAELSQVLRHNVDLLSQLQVRVLAPISKMLQYAPELIAFQIKLEKCTKPGDLQKALQERQRIKDIFSLFFWDNGQLGEFYTQPLEYYINGAQMISAQAYALGTVGQVVQNTMKSLQVVLERNSVFLQQGQDKGFLKDFCRLIVALKSNIDSYESCESTEEYGVHKTPLPEGWDEALGGLLLSMTNEIHQKIVVIQNCLSEVVLEHAVNKCLTLSQNMNWQTVLGIVTNNQEISLALTTMQLEMMADLQKEKQLWQRSQDDLVQRVKQREKGSFAHMGELYKQKIADLTREVKLLTAQITVFETQKRAEALIAAEDPSTASGTSKSKKKKKKGAAAKAPEAQAGNDDSKVAHLEKILASVAQERDALQTASDDLEAEKTNLQKQLAELQKSLLQANRDREAAQKQAKQKRGGNLQNQLERAEAKLQQKDQALEVAQAAARDAEAQHRVVMSELRAQIQATDKAHQTELMALRKEARKLEGQLQAQQKAFEDQRQELQGKLMMSEKKASEAATNAPEVPDTQALQRSPAYKGPITREKFYEKKIETMNDKLRLAQARAEEAEQRLQKLMGGKQVAQEGYIGTLNDKLRSAEQRAAEAEQSVNKLVTELAENRKEKTALHASCQALQARIHTMLAHPPTMMVAPEKIVVVDKTGAEFYPNFNPTTGKYVYTGVLPAPGEASPAGPTVGKNAPA